MTSRTKLFIAGISVAWVAAIVYGIYLVGTPQQARMNQLDETRSGDLQNIADAITRYVQVQNQLPERLDYLAEVVGEAPTSLADPGNNQPFEYHVTGATTYTLCDWFDTDTTKNPYAGNAPVPQPIGLTPEQAYTLPNFESHASGYVCFNGQVQLTASSTTSTN